MQKDSYNRGGYIAFIFSMVFSLAFFVYVTFMHPGINLKEIPEAAQAATDAGGADQTKEVEVPGAKVYANNCAVCHGPKGLGDGPAGASLNPKPRNFVEGHWKVGGDSISLFKTIQNGIPGSSMAAFGHLPVADRWALVEYIRSITENKVKDDPAKLEAFKKTAK